MPKRTYRRYTLPSHHFQLFALSFLLSALTSLHFLTLPWTFTVLLHTFLGRPYTFLGLSLHFPGLPYTFLGLPHTSPHFPWTSSHFSTLSLNFLDPCMAFQTHAPHMENTDQHIAWTCYGLLKTRLDDHLKTEVSQIEIHCPHTHTALSFLLSALRSPHNYQSRVVKPTMFY